MRLGMLGGTFDPIHRGHLDAAVAAQQALSLDRVLFVPARVPPHRPRSPLASSYHRFAMTALAVSSADHFAVSDLELERPGPSYSTDTIEALRQEGWQPWQLFFITGVDAFAEIATWRNYPAILETSHFVVVTRPGYPATVLRDRVPGLEPRILEAGPPGGSVRSDALRGPTPRVIVVSASTSDVSSTEVRRRLAEGHQVSDLVPPVVERYIRQHRLYEPQPRAPHLHGQV